MKHIMLPQNEIVQHGCKLFTIIIVFESDSKTLFGLKKSVGANVVK